MDAGVSRANRECRGRPRRRTSGDTRRAGFPYCLGNNGSYGCVPRDCRFSGCQRFLKASRCATRWGGASSHDVRHHDSTRVAPHTTFGATRERVVHGGPRTHPRRARYFAAPTPLADPASSGQRHVMRRDVPPARHLPPRRTTVLLPARLRGAAECYGRVMASLPRCAPWAAICDG